MIDVQELRIGAHYYNGSFDKPVIGKVLSINGGINRLDDIRVGLIRDMPLDEDTDSYDFAMLHELEPIPITSELLEEFGFSYHEYDNGNLWEKEFEDIYKGYFFLEYDDCLNRYDLSMFCMDEIEVHTHCRYLHELENWVYLVFEKELIKNPE